MSGMGVVEWRETFVRGALTYAVLLLLAEAPAHGYAVLQRMRERGLGHWRGGTVYPVLARLEAQGLLESSWDTTEPGPARKVYSLTPQGSRELDDARQAWREVEANLHRDDKSGVTHV
ncbi:PadR family transcriptional regulator [Citricoccus zhacaiensis]